MTAKPYAYRPLAIYDASDNLRKAIVKNQVFADLGGSLVLWERLRIGVDIPLQLVTNGQGGTLRGTFYPAPNGDVSLGDIRLAADVRLLGQYGDPFRLAAGVRGWLPTGSRDKYAGDGSGRFGGRVMAAGDLSAFVYGAQIGADYRAQDAVGAGITRGYGSPTARGLLSIEWSPAVKAPEPVLPTPEPPPADSDKDGVLDGDDACPDVPGVKTDDPKTNGCPPDRDHDGVFDAEDACPDVPGIKTTDPKTNGCPSDSDKDGIIDAEDACPDVPGIKTSDPKTNGCPDPDRDEDGIPNDVDACPDDPGKPDPDPKRNGCPKAFVQAGQIKIVDQVKFATGSAAIVPGKESTDVLEAVLAVLTAHPEIKKIRVEGHTDNQGSAALNRKLSADRAASVVKWLVDHKIDKARLTSEGFGPDKPIADNKTADGRKQNRRVEFHIVDSAAAEPAK